ncbi:MAG TPA: hypothetical protein VM008_07795 [Phycisphaerae bacterium]|nr:hypothetical protein [Phycisphaerae bacterium]
MDQQRGVTFHDYHRTVIAYHGTSTETAERLVAGEAFDPSKNDDDWFGSGIYFWEYAPKQAWWWAEKFKKKKSPAVVGAIIRLGNCLDLLDPENVRVLQAFQREMVAEWKNLGVAIPNNGNQHKKLDCAVLISFAATKSSLRYRQPEQSMFRRLQADARG